MGLVNAIIEWHPEATTAPTVQEGSWLIDSIWMTPGFEPV